MNIAVLIKHVPVSNDVSIDPVTHALVRESSEGMINPADLNALESALCIKDKVGVESSSNEVKIVAFSMGPQGAESSLRDALAIGADEACLITDRAFAGGDTVATAKTLAMGIQNYGDFDLILGGALSSDGATGQVGPMIAACLGIPHMAETVGVDVLNSDRCEFSAEKRYGDKMITAKCSGPVFISVCYGCNEPRLATLRSKRNAKNKEIRIITNQELKMSETMTGFGGSPTLVTESFEPERKKVAKLISGTSQDIADKIMELIEEKKGEL